MSESPLFEFISKAMMILTLMFLCFLSGAVFHASDVGTDTQIINKCVIAGAEYNKCYEQFGVRK